jgi:hypothetical protein
MVNASEFQLALTWPSILEFAFTTGFATALLNQGFAWLRETIQHRTKRLEAGRVLALSLVPALTSYAQKCYENLQYNQSAGYAGAYGTDEVPVPLTYAESDPGWAALPSKIAAALRDFPNEVHDAKRQIAGTREDLGPPEAIDSATYYYAALGFKAWELSHQLRKSYKFGRYPGDLSFVAQMKTKYRNANPGRLRRIWRSQRMNWLRRRVRQYWPKG